MKGGYHGLRGKQVSLTLVALICTTIFIWAWEKSPFLTTFLPPQGRLLVPSPEILLDAPKPDISVKEDISYTSPVSGTRTEQTEKSYDALTTTGSGSESTPEKSIDDVNKIDASGEKKDGDVKEFVSDDVTQQEVTTELLEKSSSVTINDGSAVNNTPKTNKDHEDTTPASINKKEIMMVPPPNETIPEQPEGKTPDIAENIFNVVTPASSSNPNTPEGKTSDSDDTLVEKKQACSYAKGKWVEDSRRPLYSGSRCKQWLSEMWACRLTQRTDFAYETFRWKPHNCEMPEFEGPSFLKRMQHKTIAIIGDSLGRQQFQSLMCMVTGGEDRPDVENVGWEYGLVKARGATRPDGWAYRFPSTNTTILYYWSASLCDLEPINSTDRNTDWAMHLDRPPAFLRRYLDRFDVLVLNTGHHWNRGKINANRWVMHVGGVRNTDRKLAEIGRAKNFTIYSIAKWVNLQLPKHPRLKAFFRTISPRHFFNGDWNTGGSCDNTTPLAGGKEVKEDKSLDPSVSGAVSGTGVKLLDITALSQLRDEGHISRYSVKATPGMQDCLHWCLPGIPDTWNELLAAQL